MVFDENDTGISGHTAQAVAEKLWDTARYRQVLCVTHLQQIACMASRHFLVEKGEENGRTTGHVHILENAAREQEIARMLGGVGAATAACGTRRPCADACLSQTQRWARASVLIICSSLVLVYTNRHRNNQSEGEAMA